MTSDMPYCSYTKSMASVSTERMTWTIDNVVSRLAYTGWTIQLPISLSSSRPFGINAVMLLDRGICSMLRFILPLSLC